MTTSHRLDYLDMAKGLGMLFVLMGHLQGDTIFALSPYFQPMCVFIFAFHMPLFFIISGILFNIKEETGISSSENIGSFVRKRFKGIMVPYYWFSFFYFLVVIYAFIKGSIAYQTVLVNLWYIVSCYGMNVLWFLPALFFGEIIFTFLKKHFSPKAFILITIILSVIAYSLAYLLTLGTYSSEPVKRLHELAITIIRPFIAFSWISVGYSLRSFYIGDNSIGNFFKNTVFLSLNESSDSKIKSKTTFRFVCIVAGIMLMTACAFLSRVNNGVDLRSLVLRNVFFYILCSLLGSYGLILICMGLPKIKLLTFWGVGSLIFMAVHNSETVLFYALKLSMFLNQYLTHARGYICYLVILLVILLYTSAMIFLIQRFFPFILGKSKKPLH